MKLSYFIWPACLENLGETVYNSWLAVSRPNDEESNENLKVYFQTFPLQKVSNEDKACQATVMKSLNGSKITSPDDEMCVKALIQDIALCEKGIGAPLHHGYGTDLAIGAIVSFSADCQTNQPVLATRISSFIEWVEETVWPDE